MTLNEAAMRVARGQGPRGIFLIDPAYPPHEDWHAHLGQAERTPSVLQGRYRRLIDRQLLDDFTPYREPDVFGGVPIFSRYKEVEFLEEFGRETADRLLLIFGLDTLDSFLAMGSITPGTMFALEIDRYSQEDPIIPRIFAANPADAAEMVGHMRLREPRSRFGRWALKTISSLGDDARFLVLEEQPAAVADQRRVFVGPRAAIAPGLMTIDALLSPAVCSEATPGRPNRRAAKVSGG